MLILFTLDLLLAELKSSDEIAILRMKNKKYAIPFNVFIKEIS